MRNKIFGRQLSRGRKSRSALFVSLTRELIIHGEIVTTLAKAKSIQGDVDKLMNKVAAEGVSARRAVLSHLRNDRLAVERVYSAWSSLAQSKRSGFTTLTHLVPRKGDAAKMVKIALTGQATEAKTAETAKVAVKAKAPGKAKPAKSATKRGEPQGVTK